METDPILQTRLGVAEMKGMLQALVGAPSERLTAHDIRLDTHDRRLSEKANVVARHDERIKDLEDDSTARSGKTLGSRIHLRSVKVAPRSDRLTRGEYRPYRRVSLR